jgi:hypothetical protein
MHVDLCLNVFLNAIWEVLFVCFKSSYCLIIMTAVFNEMIVRLDDHLTLAHLDFQ